MAANLSECNYHIKLVWNTNFPGGQVDVEWFPKFYPVLSSEVSPKFNIELSTIVSMASLIKITSENCN